MSSIPSERIAILGVVDPDVTVASAVSTDWCSMELFAEMIAIIMTGTLGTAATVAAKLEQATDSSGTGVKDITGAAITTLVEAGPDQSDSQAIINIKDDDLDVANLFNHVRLTMTVAVATSDLGGILLGVKPRFAPASDNDLASVVEIITTP